MGPLQNERILSEDLTCIHTSTFNFGICQLILNDAIAYTYQAMSSEVPRNSPLKKWRKSDIGIQKFVRTS